MNHTMNVRRNVATESTGHTQTNGAVSIGITIETAPFFCVRPVQSLITACVA
jgi:hypothetical protein